MAENNDCVTWDQQTPPILGNVGCRNPGVGFGGSGWGVGHMKKSFLRPVSERKHVHFRRHVALPAPRLMVEARANVRAGRLMMLAARHPVS
jgi:hypothetical protein